MYARASLASPAPVAQRRPITRVHHGDVFVDSYEWLRDKDDPEVISYLEAENAYTEAQTAHLSELSDAIFGEIKARTKETDLSVPTYTSHPGGNAYWYYVRTVEGSEYPIYCRVVATDRATLPDPEQEISGEEVLLDGNREAEGHEFFALGALSVSLDGRLLAYSIDLTGAERFTIMIKDLVSGELLADQIDDTAYGVAWAKNSHLFYTRADEAWRPYVILRHRLGDDPSQDVEVLTESDERYWLSVDASRDDRWIIIGAGSKITSEFRLLSTDDPEGEPRIVAPRRQGVEYDIEPAGDRLLIVHNDGAEDFELAEAPLDATSHTEWRPVIPHRQGVRILSVSAYASHAIVSLRRDGLTALHVMPRDAGGDLQGGSDLVFDEPLYVAYAPGESEYETPTIRVGYASMLTPDSIY
ncbi:MAG TPA: oligopeptidase B, partial [Propionibacteriaceae bacterium]|nr:oligopeptidase B [Propionibacteriaceae bacterium]